MGSFYIIVGVFGLLVLEFFFHFAADKSGDKSPYSIFTFWKNNNFVGLIGFYLYYVIFVGLLMKLFDIESKNILGDLAEFLVLMLPAIVIYILLRKRNTGLK